jgi:hypothetical protein
MAAAARLHHTATRRGLNDRLGEVMMPAHHVIDVLAAYAH